MIAESSNHHYGHPQSYESPHHISGTKRKLGNTIPSIFSDDDLAYLAKQLSIHRQRLEVCFRNRDSLYSLRNRELKGILHFLRDRYDRSLKISGNKKDMVHRIGNILFSNKRHKPHVREKPSYTTQIYSSYEHPTFIKKQNPYFKVIQQLLVVGFSSLYPRNFNYTANFDIPPHYVEEIEKQKTITNEEPVNQLGVHIRFFCVSTSEPKDVTFGYDSSLKVNGLCTNLSKTLKKLRIKHLADPFITPHPADATYIIKHHNQLTFTNPKQLDGFAVVQLIREQTTEAIIQTIHHTNEFKRPDLSADVQETKVLVSLRCPLGYSKIQHPCKGSNCDHLQCFDATYFLPFCHQQRVWQCPVCNKPLPFDELFYDEYFADIINTIGEEDMKVQVNPDGSFQKAKKSAPRKALSRRAHTQPVLQIVIDEGDAGGETGKNKTAATVTTPNESETTTTTTSSTQPPAQPAASTPNYEIIISDSDDSCDGYPFDDDDEFY